MQFGISPDFFFFRIPISCVAANDGFLLILVNSVKHNR